MKKLFKVTVIIAASLILGVFGLAGRDLVFDKGKPDKSKAGKKERM